MRLNLAGIIALLIILFGAALASVLLGGAGWQTFPYENITPDEAWEMI